MHLTCLSVWHLPEGFRLFPSFRRDGKCTCLLHSEQYVVCESTKIDEPCTLAQRQFGGFGGGGFYFQTGGGACPGGFMPGGFVPRPGGGYEFKMHPGARATRSSPFVDDDEEDDDEEYYDEEWEEVS